jgi:hypothetical protein
MKVVMVKGFALQITFIGNNDYKCRWKINKARNEELGINDLEIRDSLNYWYACKVTMCGERINFQG